MEILKFGDNPSPNRSNNNQRKPAAMIVAGVLVAMMGMSTTLAGTISISSGRVEFGQGLVATAACDSSITISPTSSFVNSGNDSDTFTVSQLLLSGIANACLDKYFTIKAFGGSDATSLRLVDGGGSGLALKFKIPSDSTTAQAGTFTISTGSGLESTYGFGSTTGNWTTGSGDIKITGLKIPNSVTRFTIESSDS